MAEDYWDQPAALHRRTSRVYAPGEPVLKVQEQVASGRLTDMVDRWGALSPPDRLHHVVLLGGGALGDATLQAMLERPRTA